MTFFDYGCAAHLTASDIAQGLRGALACLVVLAGLAALGRGAVRAAHFHPAHILTGWGMAAIILTLAAIAPFHALFPVALGLLVLMGWAMASAFRLRYFETPFWLLALFPGFAVLLALNLAGIARWDDFSHWVPNALYLFRYDAAPNAGLPPPHSVWPGYPYALPFLTYLASQLAAGFILQGGAMFNVLMLLSFAAWVARLNRADSSSALSWKNSGVLAVAFVAVTLANPAFNASFTITSQGDTGTMVVTAALGLLLWRLSEAMAGGDAPAVRRLRIEIALAAALLLLIKQGNIALLGLLMIGFMLIAVKNRVGRAALRQVPLLLLAAIAVRLAWDAYAGRALGGNGFQVKPFAAWRFDLLGPLLHAMLREALRKSGQFGLILLVSLTGLAALFRPAGPKRNLLVLAATVSGGHIVFLTACYLGASFSAPEIRRAASFYRYSTHVGLLNLAVVWVYAPALWGKIPTRVKLPRFYLSPIAQKSLIVAAVSVLPLALVIHRGWLVPEAGAQICGYRDQGKIIAAALLPAHGRLGVLDAEGDGLLGYVINFELALNDAQHDRDAYVIWQRDQFSGGDITAQAEAQLNAHNIDALFVPEAKTKPVTIMGRSNQAEALFLLPPKL